MIIPVLNEEDRIQNIIQDLAPFKHNLEVVVVDGGSTDSTMQRANSFKWVKVLKTDRGRAVQMNYGAKHANTQRLWFLHADSRVDGKTLSMILAGMKNTDCSGSCYLKFDKKGFWYWLYSKFSKVNWSVFTYGDQGIFIKRDLFEKLGGYRPFPIMEDIDLVRRIKKKCHFVKLNQPVITSVRRFEENGVLWQELKNIILVFLYLIGVSPFYLKRFY